MGLRSKQTADRVFQSILAAFKTILRDRGITYKDLASKLGLTEGAIKKSLASDDMSFSRMLELCAAAEISYFELVRMADEKQEQRVRFTAEQEQFLAKNLKTWRFFMDLLEMPLDQLRKKHQLSSEKVEFYLSELEKQKLLLREGAYGYSFPFEGKLVAWNPDGEFARQHNSRIAIELMSQLFSGVKIEGSYRTRASVRVTPKTRDELIDRLKALSTEIAARARREMSVHEEESLVDVSWVIGVKEFDVWGFLLGNEPL